MGGGSSLPVPPSLPAPGDPPERDDEEDIDRFPARAIGGTVIEKASQVYIEVSQEGLRLLKFPSRDPLYSPFFFERIHSWTATTRDHFSFRWYDEASRTIWPMEFETRYEKQIEQTIQRHIRVVVQRRQDKAVAEPQFEESLAQLRALPTEGRLQFLQQLALESFFSARQGKLFVLELDNSFDKIEAACILHAKLVDTNNFDEALDAPGDRENVWTRLARSSKKISENGMHGAPRHSGAPGMDVLPAPPPRTSKAGANKTGAGATAPPTLHHAARGGGGGATSTTRGVPAAAAAAAGSRIPLAGQLSSKASPEESPPPPASADGEGGADGEEDGAGDSAAPPP